MQHEIATAEQAIRSLEDRVLERMEEGENLTRDLKAAEAELKTQQAAIAVETQGARRGSRGAAEDARTRPPPRGSPPRRSSRPTALKLFERVWRSGAQACAWTPERRDGACTICHRPDAGPQLTGARVRKGENLVQCEGLPSILSSFSERRRPDILNQSTASPRSLRITTAARGRTPAPPAAVFFVQDSDGAVLDKLHSSIGIARDDVTKLPTACSRHCARRRRTAAARSTSAPDSQLLVETDSKQLQGAEQRLNRLLPAGPAPYIPPPDQSDIWYEHIQRRFDTGRRPPVEPRHGRGGA